MKSKYILLLVGLVHAMAVHAQDSTYAERLGFPKGKKVVTFHVDDVGMSLDGNQGAIEAMEKGVATSCSIMMTCPMGAGIFSLPEGSSRIADAGLHLTLTSEWKDYRWGPLSGKPDCAGIG